MAICPNCGCDKFRYQLRTTGTRGHSSHYRYTRGTSFFIPSGESDYSSTRQMASVGFCPECGYVERPKRSVGSIIVSVIGLALLARFSMGLIVIVGLVGMMSFLVKSGKKMR